MSDSDDNLQQYGNIISAIAFITAMVMGIIHGIGMFWEENKPQPDDLITKNPDPSVVQPPVVQSPVVQSPVVQSPVVQPPVVQPPVVQSPVVQPPVNKTNATVAGEPGIKNIRSGPGTVYSIVGKISTGSRVKILSQKQDRGGYLWYKIYNPSSKTEGWMAAQLISTD
ncbi:MAG: SH3 domain-containing protein [Xenococcaceae cyanobacterium MO_234.B1]|nr:SH3 domain-containing protein [Xenococcaceae cyanobacterium MO_234.B1]